MAATHDFQIPYSLNHVWNSLPAAVQRCTRASGRGNPVPGGGYRYSFSTGMNMLTWGFTVFVDLQPLPQGTNLRISPKMNFGLFDWGEGREVATELHHHLMQTLQAQPGPGQGPGQGRPGPGPHQGHPGPGPAPGPHQGPAPQQRPGPRQGPPPGHGPGYGHGHPGQGYGPGPGPAR
ncbi:hypothetical protein DFP74_4658 [Nocardiopsis sp. Huas11]|uniref:hypothetical protein n=1 Tax=Nocardiopsis sp. Huas11 TaxID=2183912 RepID=UPI000F1FB6D9|nr:hypothetical protein [Nocardiopsis sp. Huas11]RKS08932.1 hypothetical protein DFP74_4658 [Nocardiopsis sp. Huas11]